MEGKKKNGKLIYQSGTEEGRKMTVYQWRCTPEEKELLMVAAAQQRRPANRVLSDALKSYLDNMSTTCKN